MNYPNREHLNADRGAPTGGRWPTWRRSRLRRGSCARSWSRVTPVTAPMRG
jgi:hypothetical protein